MHPQSPNIDQSYNHGGYRDDHQASDYYSQQNFGTDSPIPHKAEYSSNYGSNYDLNNYGQQAGYADYSSSAQNLAGAPSKCR